MSSQDMNLHPRELIILRHAKSDWETDAPTDFERPLNSRGERDAPRMGRWLAAQGLIPDAVLASPALRAEQTLLAVAKEIGLKKKHIQWDRRIYEADVLRLLQVLAVAPPEARRVMLVGHNPGLEELAAYLCRQESLPQPPFGFLKTATVAQIGMPEDWTALPGACGILRRLVKPKDL